MGVLIRCNSTRCEKELIVTAAEAEAPFRCKEKGCKSEMSDVLQREHPLLFVIKKGSLSLATVRDGKAVFQKPPKHSKALFFTAEDAGRMMDWLVEKEQRNRSEYNVARADWDRGSEITSFDKLFEDQ
jgi:hypothetical protein